MYCGCAVVEKALSVIRSSGLSAIQGFLMYKRLWRNDQDVKTWVSIVEGCPLSEVPLYFDIHRSKTMMVYRLHSFK